MRNASLTLKGNWSMRLFAFTAGLTGFLLFQYFRNIRPLVLTQWVYEKVGITVIALMPLLVWSIWTALKADGRSDLTLSYIGTTAQRVGLLGTVIGIVGATLQIGDKLTTGAASAVTGALPDVGQALVSTAVGFVIAIICDFFRFISIRETPK